MSFKNSNLYGLMAVLAFALFIPALLRKRFKWGLLLLNVLVAAGEKWRETRELERIRSVMDRAD